MRNSLRVAVVVCLAVSAWVSVDAQQSLGSIRGVVLDPTGAAIPGAAITAKRLSTQQEFKTQTGADGGFLLQQLFPGEYELSISSPGFLNTLTTIMVRAGRQENLKLTLQLGAVAETVTVTGQAAVLSSSTASLSATVGPVPEDFNTEDYGLIRENEFLAVARRPLSTFSINVDTASYANVRRFLNEGKLPPADAVRIEELINYFSYDYPEPEAGEPFRVITEMAECPWQPKHRLVHIGLKSKSISLSDLPPNNLVFLLDVSGSMARDNKLTLVKKALRLLVDQLRAQDSVSVVVYAGAAGRVLPPTSGAQKAKIRASLDRLQAGGSTAGAQGIHLAYQTARESFISGGNNRVILATDGDFNVGVSSDGELVKLIEQRRDAGVFLAVLGFGAGNLKDAKMEKLADHGNGNYAYIDNLLEARRVFVEQAGATLLTVAKDVKLQVEFNPARIQAYRLIGYENRLLSDEDFNDDKKDAGDLGAGHSVTALYEVIPAGVESAVRPVDELRYQKPHPRSDAARNGEALTVKIRYKTPADSKSELFSQVLDYSDTPLGKASEDLRFAAAVAQFGMVLRESEHRGVADFDSTAHLADSARGPDNDGRRSEFLYLIKAARSLQQPSEISQAVR